MLPKVTKVQSPDSAVFLLVFLKVGRYSSRVRAADSVPMLVRRDAKSGARAWEVFDGNSGARPPDASARRRARRLSKRVGGHRCRDQSALKRTFLRLTRASSASWRKNFREDSAEGLLLRKRAAYPLRAADRERKAFWRGAAMCYAAPSTA